MNWQRAESLLGETIREMGVLIVVFAPLEAMFAQGATSLTRVVAVALLGAVLVASGIILETRK
jgi:type IV secretory pathway VirB2 component (pilin)